MKVKTSELIGVALDYAVALCLGVNPQYNMSSHGRIWKGWWIATPYYNKLPNYSTNWQQGGPIIEREGITIKKTWENGTLVEGIDAWYADIDFINQVKTLGEFRYYGPTSLIAAMRCYAASKLGEEIEIPDELIN